MKEITIPVYSDQALSPRAGDSIRNILSTQFPDYKIKFRDYKPGFDKQVLVFGRAPEGEHPNTKFVYTYSIAQLMSKANSVSVISAGIRQFITEPEDAPFRKPLGTVHVYKLCELDFTKPVAIDIETNGNLGHEDTPDTIDIISVAFYQPGNAPIVIVSEDNYLTGYETTEPLLPQQVEALSLLLPQFEYGIYHNGKFDIRVMDRVFGTKLKNSFDTMLAHHVLNQAAGDHKLKSLARRYLAAPDWETGLSGYLKKGGHFENIPEAKLVEYNGWDVYWTYKLWEFLQPQIEADENSTKAFEFEMAAAKTLLTLEQYGIPLDVEYANRMRDMLEEQIAADLASIQDRYGLPGLNPGSPKQVKQAFLDLYDYEVTSTNKVYLADLVKSELPEAKEFVQELARYREKQQERSTYYIQWVNRSRNGRVHATYLVHGTSTGRLSSAGPNVQNMPREKRIRKMVRTGD